MTREDAQKVAQEKLASAVRLVQEAMALAEEHKFVLDIDRSRLDYSLPCELPYEHAYLPADITREQLDGWEPWCGITDDALERNYGRWMSSSEMGDC